MAGKNKNEGTDMRIFAFALSIALTVASGARAAEIHVLMPPIIANAGFKELGAAYSKDTGTVITNKVAEMGKLTDDLKASAPMPDLVFMPSGQMDALDKAGGIRPGSRANLGRVEIGLGVRPGAPHPDISTVAKLVAVLNGAKSVVYSNPAGGSMQARIIDNLLKRPEFARVHKMISSKGNGASALARGDAEMALQLEGELIGRPGVELVGPLPAELHAGIDTEVAVPAAAPDPDQGLALLHYLTRPEADAVWKSHGLERVQ
jgi:molybdate transport system substrate-binding protein